jgi:hypothetical protein
MEKKLPSNLDDDRRLERRDAAKFLTEHGFRVAAATLAKLAVLGGGPPYEKFGRRPLYRANQLLAWAHSRTTRLRSTSERAG